MQLSVQLKDENLTLEEKLELIDEMMKNTQVENKKRTTAGLAPSDPSLQFICDGCE